MLLSDEAVGAVVDRFMLERFITAAQVSAKKLRHYAALTTQGDVRRHFTLMAEANDNAARELGRILPGLP